jgi:hypothetical protein
MPHDLQQIKSLPSNAITLIEALGISTAAELAQQDFRTLHDRLVRMNALRPLWAGELTEDEVAHWVMTAKAHHEQFQSLTASRSDVESTIEEIPEAILLDDDIPMPARRGVTMLPRDGSGKRDVEMKPQLPTSRQGQRATVGSIVRSPAPASGDAYVSEPDRTEMKARFRSMDAYQQGETGGVQPLQRRKGSRREPAEPSDIHDDSSEATEQTPERRQKAPTGRRHRKGVDYPHAFKFHVAALIVMIFKLLLIAMIIGLPLVIYPAMFQNQRQPLFYFLPAVALWLIFGFLYLAVALRVKCRVCTNPFFLSKRCHKHVKAHRLLGLGYSFCLALHGFLFGWMRCMYCGTAIKVRR